MTGGDWAVPISDDDAANLLRQLAEHGPAKYDWWCRCGQFKVLCGREREYGVQLAIANRMRWPVPWALPDGQPKGWQP